MEHTDREYCLEVWGDMACFTRPELKVERVSYDVITPSAARAIFEAIFWKPAIHWQITKIEVLKPIKWTSVRRNEVGAVAGKSVIFIEEKRQQKNTLLLKDVGYRIWAKMEFRSVSKRKAEGDLFRYNPHMNPSYPLRSQEPYPIQSLHGTYSKNFPCRTAHIPSAIPQTDLAYRDFLLQKHRVFLLLTQLRTIQTYITGFLQSCCTPANLR